MSYHPPSAIRHASNCNAKGTLAWKSAPFRVVIVPDGEHVALFIHLWWPVQFYPGLLVPRYSGGSLGDSLSSDTLLLALFVDFYSPYSAVFHCAKIVSFMHIKR